MPKIDPAHEATEKRIEEIERKIRKEYSEAEHGVQLRLQEYWGAFQIKDEKKRELLKAGKISEEEYQHWRTGQIAVGKRWEDMRKTIAQDFMNANNIARKIADDSKADVFAINGNYAFYEIERRAGIDMSFSLYNHESVIRLIRDNPDVLPPLSRYGENNAVKRAIREGRIQAWEEGKIQSALTQGILQGMSTAQLTKHISEHVGALNESYARRYARTAITGAQNAGRYESFRRAKKLGVDLVVEWNAILDRRTRRTHRHMHGERHEVDEPFEIDGHEILYPGYPLALDELIWNCRCTLLSWVRGYEPETVKESPGMEGMTFEEWQNAKGAKEKGDENVNEPLTFQTRIDKIKKDIKKNGGVVTEDHLKQAGKAIADEHESYIAPKRTAYETALAEADKKAAKLQAEYERLGKEREALLDKYDLTFDKKERERIADRLDEISAARRKAIRDKNDVYGLYKVNELRKAYIGNQIDNEEWLASQLSKIRSIGIGDNDIVAHLNNSRSPVRKYVEEAYSRYPTDWVDKSVAKGTMTPKKVDRGYYGFGEIAISGYGKNRDSYMDTALHELGHRFEDSVPGIKKAEKAFYDRRTAGSNLEWLGGNYAKWEKTRKDDFLNPYMGKDYGGNAYELVSMGFQMAYQEPVRLAKDKDMQEWIYGILCLL